MRLAFSLWGDGFVCVKPAPAAKGNKDKKEAQEGAKGKQQKGKVAEGAAKQGKRKAEEKPAEKAVVGKAKKARN